jgi:thymidylate kinase
LDGSGKTTVIDRLKGEKMEGIQILKAPHYDVNLLKHKPQLHEIITAVNDISSTADARQWTRMKAVALFMSMLMYRDVVRAITNASTDKIITERHPAIDSIGYASFYVSKLRQPIEKEAIDYVLRNHSNLITNIGEILSVDQNIAGLDDIRNLILNVFEEPDTRTMAQLFRTNLPDKVYYLRARSAVLMDRISNRSGVSEPHEKEQVLEMMYRSFMLNLNKLSNDYSLDYVTVDANAFAALDQFYVSLKTELV